MGTSIIRTCAWFVSLLALGVLGAWAVTRVVSDRMLWSQFVFWVPTPVVLVLVALLVMGAAGLAWWGKDRGLAGRVFRRTLGVAWVGALGYMLLGEWHAQRYVSPVARAEGEAKVRVLFWNAVQGGAGEFSQRVLAEKPDVLITANASLHADWIAVRNGIGEKTYTVRNGRLAVVSKYPIVRWGFTNLGITGSRARVFTWYGGGSVIKDEGESMFVELDTTAEVGRTMVVWELDLPSDPNLSRWSVMGEAAGTLAGFVGPAWKRTVEGLDEREEWREAGYPTADIVVGDFNTPRGSVSMTQITGEMTNAFEQAGRGNAGTWEREWPVIGIDQAFVGPGLRAVMYRAVDMGSGEHRAVVFDVVKK